jgi:hypothetical protein
MKVRKIIPGRLLNMPIIKIEIKVYLNAICLFQYVFDKNVHVDNWSVQVVLKVLICSSWGDYLKAFDLCLSPIVLMRNLNEVTYTY